MKASAKPSRTSARVTEFGYGNRFPRQLILGALLITLFAFGLRFGLRNAGMFHYDEVITVRALEHWQQTGEFRGETSGRQGFVLINGLFYFPKVWLTGNPSAERIPQFTSAIFGSLLCGLLVLLAYQIFRDKQLAYTAGFLAAVNPLLLSQGTIGKEHSMAAFFLFLALAALVRYWQGGGWVTLAAASALLGVALSIRESALAFVPLLLGFGGYAIAIRYWGKRWQWGKSIGATIALLLPFLLLLAPLCASTLCPLLYDVAFDSTPTVSTVYYYGSTLPLLQLGVRDLLRSMTPVGLLLGLSGLYIWWRQRVAQPVLVLCTLWVLLFFYFAGTAGYAPRFLFELIPVLLLGAAIALASLTGDSRWRWIIAVTLLGMLSLSTILPLLTYRHQRNELVQFAQLIGDHTEPDAVILTMDDAVFLQYYANRTTLAHPLDAYAASADAWIQHIRALLRNGTPVYALSMRHGNTTALLDYDATFFGGGVYRLLDESFTLTPIIAGETENYHHAELVPQWREEVLEQVALKLG